MKLKNALKWMIHNPMEIIATAALIASITISTVNALLRYTIRWTWTPGTDVITLCFGWLVFCGAAAAWRRGMHYGIELAVNKLPPKAGRVVRLFTHFLLIAILVYGTWLSYNLCAKVGGRIMSNTKISYLWFDLSALTGFAFMSIYEIQNTLKAIKEFKPANNDTEAES